MDQLLVVPSTSSTAERLDAPRGRRRFVNGELLQLHLPRPPVISPPAPVALHAGRAGGVHELGAGVGGARATTRCALLAQIA